MAEIRARKDAERALVELRQDKLKQTQTQLRFAELMAMGKSLETWLSSLHEMPELTGWRENMDLWVNQTRITLYELGLHTDSMSFFQAADSAPLHVGAMNDPATWKVHYKGRLTLYRNKLLAITEKRS